HRRAKVGSEEQIEQDAQEKNQAHHAHEHRGIALADGPPEDIQITVGAEKTSSEQFDLAGERRLVQQRHIALAHDVKIHRIKRCHHEDAAKQAVDLELGVQ